MAYSCEQCKALCCQYFCFEIDEPDTYGEYEDIRWYLCHDGVSVHIEENGDWYIQIENRCNKLDSKNRCTIYENRPLICRTYDNDNCEASGEDYGYIEEFTTPEQLDEYARKTLGDETYEKEMVKRRAKLDGVSRKEMKQRLADQLVAIAPTAKSGKNSSRKKKTKKSGRAGRKKK